MAARILLVDDNPMVRRMLRLILSPSEFTCYEAESGEAALNEACTVEPDLIILDFAMPNMSGMEVAPLLHQLLPSVPIILFTLYAGTILESEARQVGISAVVSKSDPAGTLLREVQALLQPRYN